MPRTTPLLGPGVPSGRLGAQPSAIDPARGYAVRLQEVPGGPTIGCARRVVVSGGRRVIAKESSAYFIRGRVRVTQPDDRWFDVDTYEAGAVHAPATQDSHLVAFVGQTLRLAVIDGVTPTPRTAGFSGVDGAVWAAGVVRTLLAGSGRDVGEVLQDANRVLWSAEVGDSRDQQQATVLVAEVLGRGDRLRVRLTRAGDCMAWTKAGESWTPAFSPVAHTPEVRKEIEEWLRRPAQRRAGPQ